jgi:AbrB family looped-hinge helix DNA binding protein
MGATEYQTIVNSDSRTVQAKGEVTLPKEWREEHGVEPEDVVAVKETDDGRLEIIPPE